MTSYYIARHDVIGYAAVWHRTPMLQLDCGTCPQYVQRLYLHKRAFGLI